MSLTTEEKVQNAIKWVDELLTTDVKQGYGKLGDMSDGYCCLGLGCHTLGLQYDPDYYESWGFQKVVGLRTAIGMFDQTSLVTLNDLGDFSFKQIGEVIKKKYHSLFEEDVAKALDAHWG